jgi:Rieske Fe-S protein
VGEALRLERVKLSAAGTFAKENASVARHFFGDRLKRADASVEDLGPGEGALVTLRGRKTAAYRDHAGHLHALSPRCTHLGCHLAWNPAERSWDCPCHGSRFSGEGRAIQGPAARDLTRRDSDEDGRPG